MATEYTEEGGHRSLGACHPKLHGREEDSAKECSEEGPCWCGCGRRFAAGVPEGCAGDTSVVSADGSEERGRAAAWDGVAVRAEVGWLSLSGVSRWQTSCAAVEGG